MRRALTVIIILVCVFSISGCSKQETEAAGITVCAAASLREALNEIGPGFEKSSGVKLTFNFGASGALQKQIEEGAPADLFISAGKKQMDTLEEKSLIDKETRKNLLGNRLVLIIPNEYKDKIMTMDDLETKAEKISIGEPESVPAGQYAKDSLTYLGLWDKLSGKIVYAKDVKQVVAYVEAGEAAAGLVYSSDAVGLKNSMIVQTLDESSHKPVVYPAAIVAASVQKESSKAFLEYLQTKEAQQVFVKYGFEINVK